jgi:hypothetical protein
MSPEEVIGKFVSFELMIKGSKQIVNLEQGGTSTPEVQPVAFKVTEEKKEEIHRVGSPSMLTQASVKSTPTTRRCRSSSRASVKSSSKGGEGLQTPLQEGVLQMW